MLSEMMEEEVGDGGGSGRCEEEGVLDKPFYT
jgi:hypothetical protein